MLEKQGAGPVREGGGGKLVLSLHRERLEGAHVLRGEAAAAPGQTKDTGAGSDQELNTLYQRPLPGSPAVRPASQTTYLI